MPHYPRHLSGFDYRGFQRYFLTFCTFERDRHFVEAVSVSLVGDQILRVATEQHVAIIAYCFMPDHLHLVVEGTDKDADLKTFVARAKQFSGFYFRQKTGHRLWQRYGFERVLRADEDTASVVKYVIENPLRAGLVNTPLDYPFCGGVYSREALLDYISQAGEWAG